jgi:hypothetical protein
MPSLKECQDIPFTTNEDAVHNPKVRKALQRVDESLPFFNHAEL